MPYIMFSALFFYLRGGGGVFLPFCLSQTFKTWFSILTTDSICLHKDLRMGFFFQYETSIHAQISWFVGFTLMGLSLHSQGVP